MVKKIDNKVYYQVAGWMINELNLSGQELICYAIIYSLSQLGQGWYNAGLGPHLRWAGNNICCRK